jgi:hypothetical protein
MTTDDMIFVSIASYRDPELWPTLRALLAAATHPHALRVVVCDQYGPEGQDWPQDLAGEPRIERIAIPWERSQGACWARAMLMERYRDEAFFLQLDSHHRFVQGWDAILREELAKTGRAKAVLTGYVNAYTPASDGEPERLDDQYGPQELHFDAFHNDGIAVFRPVVMSPEIAATGRPTRARFISGHFLFAHGAFVREVPYDPKLYFIGEEISLSARAFMEGWYLYHPSRVVVFHEYTRAYRAHKHWVDHSDAAREPWWRRDIASREAVSALLHDRTRRGSARSLIEYEDYAGLCFALQRVHPDTLAGLEPPTRVAPGWQRSGARYGFRVSIPAALLEEAEAAGYWYLMVYDAQGTILYRKEIYPADLQRQPRDGEDLCIGVAFDAACAPARWSFYAASDGELSHVSGEIRVLEPEPPTVYVTALVDLGRERLVEPRSYDLYRGWLEALLRDALPQAKLIVYCAPEDAAWVRAARRSDGELEVRALTLDALRALEGFDQIERIRQDPAWSAGAGWLADSPQRQLEGYAALVMHKLTLLAQVARDLPDTQRAFWVDAGLTRTVRPELIDQLCLRAPEDTLRFFGYPYPVEAQEIHGFSRAGLEAFCDHPVEIVLRGGCFGGRARVIERAHAHYARLKQQTLAAGYLGTEESLFSLLHARQTPEFMGVVKIGEDGLIPNEPCGRAPWRATLPAVPDRVEFAAAARAIVELDRAGAPAHIRLDGANAWSHAALLAPWLRRDDFLSVEVPQRAGDATMAFVQGRDIARAFETLHELPAPSGSRRWVQTSAGRELPEANAGESGALYLLTFNAPQQLGAWLDHTARVAPALLKLSRRVVVNNSTDPGVSAAYDVLCSRYGLEQLRFENIGITGGRWAATRHFLERTDAEQMWYFEDDMMVSEEGGACRNGFMRHVPALVERVTRLVAHEAALDMLKLSYSEHFGCHQLDWAWVNTPPEERAARFEQGNATVIRTIRSSHGVPWALGDVHYSHWPAVLTRRGAALIWPERGAPTDEASAMLHVSALQKSGALSCGVLLASPIKHHRSADYDGALRREHASPSEADGHEAARTA